MSGDHVRCQQIPIPHIVVRVPQVAGHRPERSAPVSGRATIAGKWLIVAAACLLAGVAALSAAYFVYATDGWLNMREHAVADVERYERDLDYPNRESALRGAQGQLAAVKEEFWTRVGVPALVLGIECLVLLPLWRAAERRVGRWRLVALAVFMAIAMTGVVTLFLLYAMRGVITG